MFVIGGRTVLRGHAALIIIAWLLEMNAVVMMLGGIVQVQATCISNVQNFHLIYQEGLGVIVLTSLS